MFTIPRGYVTPRQKAAALIVALIVDVIQMLGWQIFAWGAISPFQDGLDLITALALVSVCGFRWQLALAFGAELIPGLALFPTWTTFVLTIPTFHEAKAPQQPVAANPPTIVTATRIPPIAPLPEQETAAKQ